MKNKWTLLAFLCATFVVYTVDRALLGPLTIPIQRDTGVTDLEIGILNAAVFWTYAAIVPLSGYAGDRFNRAKLIGVASVIWSVMTLLTGFANGFWSLFLLVSFAVTAPQTIYSPSAVALIAAHHRETRTVALASHQAAFYIGWLSSGAAVAAVLAVFGSWRAAYFLFGTVGIVLGVAFILSARKSAKEPSAAAPKAAKPSFGRVVKAFFCCPSAIIATLGHVAFTAVAFGYTAWGPAFVSRRFGVSTGAAGTGVMFWHFAPSFCAILLAGFVTDRLIGRFPRFRLALQATTLLLAAPVLVAFGLSDSLAGIWAAAALFGVMRGLFEANSVNSVFDVVPPECRASAMGFINVFAGTLGSLAPMTLGWASEKGGVAALGNGFAWMGAVLVAASALMCVSLFFTFNRDRIAKE